MNFTDIRKKFSGSPSAGADPSRAFGSEAEMMEALRRQEFTPPKPRPTAAEVMGSIRQHLVRATDAPHERMPRDESAARTYAPEALGQPEWENPFTAPEKPKRPARDVPVYETVTGDMPFERRRSTAAYAPQNYAPYGGYAPSGMAPPSYPYYAPYGAPVRDPRYAPPTTPYASGAYYPPEGYAAPAYAPAPEYTAPAHAAPTPEYTAASAYAAAPDYTPAQGYAPPEYAASVPEYAAQGGYSSEYMPPEYAGEPAYPPQNGGAPAARRRKKPEGADLRYLLWSGSIVSGVLLTLVAFVYACTI